MRSGFSEALQETGISSAQSGEDLLVTLSVDQVERFVQLASSYILPGCWNEVVGSTWLFIFEDGPVYWDSLESEQVLLKRCKGLEPSTASRRSLMEMLWSCEFYRDVLYHAEYGEMINSAEFSGTPGNVAKAKVTQWLEEHQLGKHSVNYRLRDWLISRQRYWGAPIPIIYCPEHGPVPVPEDQLPVLLPDDVEWQPTGESPLKLHETWKLATCPICGGPAERETDTMDTFMCSSWYHLRYLSPDYQLGPFDPAEYEYWMPVDTYTGGIEHANMHLIYTRFFHKACRDMGITQGAEPMIQLRNQGIILGEDSEKMSKSRGNVVAPDALVHRYGADTVRAYLMFFARWEMGAPWNSSGIEGTIRWLRRVWTVFTEPAPGGNPSPETLRTLRRKVHQTLRKVTHDFETFEFNTIVSALMELLNDMYKAREQNVGQSREWSEALRIYVHMLAPISPHIAEELWERLGKAHSIHNQPWPQVDEAAAAEDEITLVVQVNGKVRDRILVPVGIDNEAAQAAALASPAVQTALGGKQIRKVIVVPGKLVNLVI
jgi:leucyl-tRNA synthetase